MKYSVIIPVYNASKTLHRCVDSVLAQSFTDFELLLINDGSKDNSGEICDEYAAKDSRVRVFHKKNGGVSSARNVGLDNAKGEWITFIDADDYPAKRYFPEKEFDSDLIFQNWKNSVLNKFDEYFPPARYTGKGLSEFLKLNLHKTHICSPWGKFFRRDIISLHNTVFDKKFSLGEDTLFVLEYLLHVSSIRILDSSMYMHAPNSESSKYPQNIGTSLAYLHRFMSLYRKCGYENSELIRMRYRMFKDCTVDFNKFRWYLNRDVIMILSSLYVNRRLPSLMCAKIKSLLHM